MKRILVLLAGTNPLPNYITALYCKDEYDILCLIYSEENREIAQKSTFEYAENIKRQLEQRGIKKEVFCIPLNDVSSAREIERDLSKYKDKFKDASIHLNYTGGTKVMAVHVHKFFSNHFNENSVFSYLDPRALRICFDDGENKKVEGIHLTIDEILNLHGYERRKEEVKIPESFTNFLAGIRNNKIEGFRGVPQGSADGRGRGKGNIGLWSFRG